MRFHFQRKRYCLNKKFCSIVNVLTAQCTHYDIVSRPINGVFTRSITPCCFGDVCLLGNHFLGWQTLHFDIYNVCCNLHFWAICSAVHNFPVIKRLLFDSWISDQTVVRMKRLFWDRPARCLGYTKQTNTVQLRVSIIIFTIVTIEWWLDSVTEMRTSDERRRMMTGRLANEGGRKGQGDRWARGREMLIDFCGISTLNWILDL